MFIKFGEIDITKLLKSALFQMRRLQFQYPFHKRNDSSMGYNCDGIIFKVTFSDIVQKLA